MQLVKVYATNILRLDGYVKCCEATYSYCFQKGGKRFSEKTSTYELTAFN